MDSVRSRIRSPSWRTPSPPDTIEPNTSIQETVQFAPTADGPVSATWLLEGNDGNGVQTVTLNGTGYTPAAATAADTTTNADDDVDNHDDDNHDHDHDHDDHDDDDSHSGSHRRQSVWSCRQVAEARHER